MELKERFPDNVAEIDAYSESLLSAEKAGDMVGAERAMPEPLRYAHHW
jgi:all-trans-retinol 13,14-reductase